MQTSLTSWCTFVAKNSRIHTLRVENSINSVLFAAGEWMDRVHLYLSHFKPIFHLCRVCVVCAMFD